MEGEDDRDVLPPGEASDNHDAQEADYKMLKTLKTLLASNVHHAYHLPLSPSAPHVALANLATHYSAVDFLKDLTTFLKANIPTALLPNEFNTYNIFHNINILKPGICYFDNSKRACKVHTSPSKPRVGH